MPPRYFQGISVTGSVRASAEHTFREVVDRLRICITLPLTRANFLALPPKERNEAKQVPYFVPACFSQSPSPRDTAHATHCNLIFLDIDPEKEKRDGKWVETGKCPAAPFVSNPDALYTALEGFNFAAHTTASSTPQKPRMRVIVDAHEIPLDQYAQAVNTIGALLGLKVTTESKVSVQPMFLPTLFSDSSAEDEPLIAHRLDARAFRVSDIADSSQDEFASPALRTTADPCIDALAFLRAPVPEITLAIAKEALASVDPDCSYHEWLEMAAALRHQFSPHKSEEAYAIFDEWSAGGEKYGGPNETQAKWDSLRPSPIGRCPVTIRSLLKLAQNAGWDDKKIKKIKDEGFNQVVSWMEGVESITELMEQGVQKILGTPLLSNMQEDVLAHQLSKQAKKRFGHVITSTAIKKDMAKVKAEMKAKDNPTEKVREPLWAKGVLYVSTTQEFFRHRTGEKYKPAAFDATYSRHLLPSEDSLKEAGLPVTPANLARPILDPTDYALNFLKITTVYDSIYDPSQPTEMFVSNGSRYVNTYKPTYPEPDSDNAETAGSLFQRHLANLVAEPKYRSIITDFIAYHIQSPGRKIRWAVLIQSVEGAGKTFLAEVMKAILGKEHVKTISGETIKSGYNEWAKGHQLVVIEEVRVAGTSRHDIMNKLKPLITNDDISVDEKYRNNTVAENISNYLLFSNHHDALSITPGDRRYFVIKSPMQSKAQVLALGKDYFPPLYAMLQTQAGALRSYFASHEISPDFCPNGHAPRTKYVQDLINDSASDLTAAVRRIILEGDFPLMQYDILSARNLMDMLSVEEGLHRPSVQHLAQVLREEGYHQIGRHVLGSERHYLWVRSGVDDKTAPGIAAQRLKDGSKNLCMELIY